MTPCTVSINELHKLTGLSFDRVTAALRDSGTPPTDTHAGHPRYDLETAVRAIVASLEAPSDPSRMSPRQQRDYYAAQRAKLALQIETGEYAPRAAYREANARLLQALRQTLDGIPDALERRFGISPEAVEHTRQVVDEAIEATYRGLRAIHEEATRADIKAEDIADLIGSA